VVKITKIQPTQTVSPSSTAARMGVVDVSVPSISNITNKIADSLNTFSEAQAKLYDANWMNDYEFNTGMYVNEKVNNIIMSGENPNLEQFTTEMNAYNDSVLANAPERLKIAANSYFQQKFISSFEVLREQSNTITFNENKDKFDVWYNNIIQDAEYNFFNIARTASSPTEALSLIHEYSGTVLTKALGSLKGRYEALEPFSGGSMNGADLKLKELAILEQVEIARVNAITAAFYQNVDVQNPDEMAAANLAHANWQNDYILNKNNTRGVNFDVFEDATGVKVGEEIMNKVITANNQYLAKIQNNNLVKKTKEDGSSAVTDYSLVNTIEKQLGQLNTFSGQYDLFVTTEGPPGQNYTKPLNFNEMKSFFELQDVKVTDAKIQKLVNLNEAKYKTRKLYNLGAGKLIDGQFQDPETKVSFLVDQMLSDEQITAMGGKEVIMDGYYNTIFSNFGYTDTVEFYNTLPENELETLSKVFQYENYIPKGYQNWFASLGPVQILQMETDNITEQLNKKLPTFDFVTAGGFVQPKGMSDDVWKFYSVASEYRAEGIPLSIISQMMKKKSERSKEVQNAINSSNQDYIQEFVIGNEKEYFVNAMLEMWKVNYTAEGEPAASTDKGVYSYKLFGAVLPRDEAAAKFALKEYFDKNQPYVEALISQKTQEYFGYLSEEFDDDNQKKIRFERSIMYAFNGMDKAHFGNTEFMDNVPGTSYRYMPVEKEHKSLENTDIKLAMAAYTYNNLSRILQDPNHELFEVVQDQFTLPNETVELPTIEKVIELIESGNIYLVYREDGGSGTMANYDVVVSNSGTGYLEPDNFDRLNKITFDGRPFNPTIYTGGGLLTKSNLINRYEQEFSREYGQAGFLDSIEERFIAPIVIWSQDKFGDLNVEANMAKLYQQLYEDDSFYKYNTFQNTYKTSEFNTKEDRIELFKEINNGMNELLETVPVPYSEELTTKTFDYVNEQYFNQSGITKAFLSRVLLDNPNIDKEALFNAVESGDKDFFKALYNNPNIDSYFDFFFKPDIFKVNE